MILFETDCGFRMPLYRTLEDFGDLLPAETQVLAEMHDGPLVELGPALPALRDGSRKLRAEFVAFLARGGGEGAELYAKVTAETDQGFVVRFTALPEAVRILIGSFGAPPGGSGAARAK